MTPCSFFCIAAFVQLDNVRYITVRRPLKQFINLGHITTCSSICKCGKFRSLKPLLVRNILNQSLKSLLRPRKLLSCPSLHIFYGIFIFLLIRDHIDVAYVTGMVTGQLVIYNCPTNHPTGHLAKVTQGYQRSTWLMVPLLATIWQHPG